MKRINRQQIKFLLIAGAAIAIMLPVALVKSETVLVDYTQPHSDSARTASVMPNGLASTSPNPSNSGSRELAVTAEDSDDADHTDELPGENSLSDGESEKLSSSNPAFPDDRLEPTREWMSIPERSGNRSVVGWNSASISNLQPRERIAPASLEISSLLIKARVDAVNVDSDGAMEIPDDRDTVGWYRHGAAPGDPGSTVIAGHLDDANGRSVFFDLQLIEIGATVLLTQEDGTEAVYRVFEKVSYPSDNLPSKTIFSREGDPVLALLTCGGNWDREAGRYTETVVIYAELVEID